MEILGHCLEYLPAIRARWSPFPSESLFMSVMLTQHARIATLAGEVEKLKAKKDARVDT